MKIYFQLHVHLYIYPNYIGRGYFCLILKLGIRFSLYAQKGVLISVCTVCAYLSCANTIERKMNELVWKWKIVIFGIVFTIYKYSSIIPDRIWFYHRFVTRCPLLIQQSNFVVSSFVFWFDVHIHLVVLKMSSNSFYLCVCSKHVWTTVFGSTSVFCLVFCFGIVEIIAYQVLYNL